MALKNTNDGKNQQRLFLRKFFVVFVLFWVQSFQGQLTISGGAAIYSESANLAEQSDLDFKVEENSSKAKIYISSDVKILTANVEANFEIVKINGTKKHIASKNKSTRNSKKINVESAPIEKRLAQAETKVTVETFQSKSESDVALSVHQNHSIAVAQCQNTVVKHILNAGFTSIETHVLDAIITKTSLYLADFDSKMSSDSFSVRPPPSYL